MQIESVNSEQNKDLTWKSEEIRRETQQIRWTKEHLQIENAHKRFELHDIYSKYEQLIYGIYVVVK